MKAKNLIIAVMGTVLLMERFFQEAAAGEKAMNYIVYTMCLFILCSIVDYALDKKTRKKHWKHSVVRKFHIYDMKKAE